MERYKSIFKESVGIDEVEYMVNQFKKAGAIRRYDQSDIDEIIANINNARGRLSVDEAVRNYFNLEDWEDLGNY